MECVRRQVDALAVLKGAAEPLERAVLGLSHPSGLAVVDSGDGIIETVLAAPSSQFARLKIHDSGKRRAGPWMLEVDRPRGVTGSNRLVLESASDAGSCNED